METAESANIGNTQRIRYMEVRNALLEDINSGRITDGQKIASEQELCERFKVSRITIRKAVEGLAREGLLEKQPGRGTYARISGMEPSLMSLGGFQTASRFRTGPRRKILEKWFGELSADDSALLGLEPASPAAFLRRLLCDGDVPLAIDATVYPESILHDFLNGVDETTSTFEHMRHEYGRNPSGSHGTLLIGFATAEEADLLQIPMNEPVIRLEKIIGDQDGTPIAVSRLAANPIRVHFVFDAGVPLVHI